MLQRVKTNVFLKFFVSIVSLLKSKIFFSHFRERQIEMKIRKRQTNILKLLLLQLKMLVLSADDAAATTAETTDAAAAEAAEAALIGGFWTT